MTSSECLRLLVILMQVHYIIMLLMTSLERLTHVSIHGAMNKLKYKFILHEMIS